jgi:methanogenic corrinoid protein MtbC1
MIPGARLSIVEDNARQSERKDVLTRIVEAQILPRLAQAGRIVKPDDTDRMAVTIEGDTSELVRMLLIDDASGALALIHELQTHGATPAELFLGVVTLAARRLGELWERDLCDFTQVTIGMGRLQQVLRALSPSFQVEAVRRAQTESVLLVPAPGEQHTFGLMMLAEFFQREGWHVAGGPATTAKDAADIAHGTWMDVAGFSIGSVARLESLAQCIRTVRRASSNRDLFVMVGGPLFLTHPDLVTRVGADAVAGDAVAAVRQARGSLAMRSAAD